MHALILAGGLGTRLRTRVSDRPKVMAEFGGRPFLDYLLAHLARGGVDEVVICAGHRHAQIRDHFGDGRPWGVRIRYSVEDRPLGTAGALKLAEPLVDGPFLLLNGDTFVDLELEALVGFHRACLDRDQDTLGTIAVAAVAEPTGTGSVLLSDDRRIRSFAEKSAQDVVGGRTLAPIEDAGPGGALVNAGLYVLEPEVLEHIAPDKRVSLEHTTFPAILEGGGRLYGFVTEGVFVDIGTPVGYDRFTSYIEEHGA